MYFLWFLPAVLLAVLLYPLWQIGQSGARALRNSIPSGPQPSAQPNLLFATSERPTWSMEWISTDEFIKVLAKSSDFIRIKRDVSSIPSVVSTAFAFLAARCKSHRVLKRHISEQSTASHGRFSLSVLLTGKRPGVKDSTPFRLLNGGLAIEEVA